MTSPICSVLAQDELVEVCLLHHGATAGVGGPMRFSEIEGLGLSGETFSVRFSGLGGLSGECFESLGPEPVLGCCPFQDCR